MLAGSTFRYEAEQGGSGAGNSWDHCEASNFELRVGPNYDKNKRKGPSPESLMELVAVDLIRCESRIDNIASKVTFPPEWSVGCDPSWKFPHIFVVNVQLPSEFPTSFFTEITDGPGWSLVLYYKIRPEVSESLAAADKEGGSAPAPSGAAMLWARYCDGICAPGSNNPWIGRFKVIISCLNIEQYGLPSFIASYNSKPVLIRNTASYFRGDSYVEIDVNVHRFGSLPKKALSTQIERLNLMEFNIGFCIESRSDDEMPECIFGCARLNKPNQNTAPNWSDVTAPPPPATVPRPAAAVSPAGPPAATEVNGPAKTAEAHDHCDHGVFRLVSFMRHRNALLEMWRLLAGHDTSFGGHSPVDSIPSVDLVCSKGDPLVRNESYRQCGLKGKVVEHMNELFEVAEVVKPHFESGVMRIAAECSLPTKGRASSASPTSTRSGLVMADTKSVARVAEKIRERYLHVAPGPACSWVYDVLRASYVCDTQEQIQLVYEALRDDPAFTIVRLKNRFLNPTSAGFRDILMNVLMTIPGPSGAQIKYICEVQITHVDLRQYEIENDTRALYRAFWPLLKGTEENKSRKLTILKKIIDVVAPIVDSLMPSGERMTLHKRIAQVEDAITKHYDEVHIRDDIEALRDWTQVLEAIENLPLAEQNQRKVLKLVLHAHNDGEISIANEYLKLGHILKMEMKYSEAFRCYEIGTKTLGAVFGKSSTETQDAVHEMAVIRYLAQNRAGEPSGEEVAEILEEVFGKSPAASPAKPQRDSSDAATEKSVETSRPAVSASEVAGLLVRQHSETHHSAYDSAPLNYNTKPPEMLEPIPDLWDLVSSSESDFEYDD